MAGLLRKVGQNRGQMTRSDSRCAAAEPEDADGRFVLAREQRSETASSAQLCCCSLLAAAVTGPQRLLNLQQLLPSQRALLASLPRAVVQLYRALRSPRRAPHGEGLDSLGRPLGSSGLEQVRGSSLKDGRQQAVTGKRQDGRALKRPARACQCGRPALHRRPALCLRGRVLLPPAPGPRSGSTAPAGERHRGGGSAPLRARGAAARRAWLCAGSLPACPGRRARRGEAAKR